MTLPSFTVVIPARYASTRFPGKTLHPIHGKPMILHTIDRARESSADTIVVATDHGDVRRVCEEAGHDVQMTDPAHPSGTDRIAEVADIRDWSDDRLIVGLQCDEPATAPEHLNLLAGNLMHQSTADMATLCMRITQREDYENPNRVKVVRDAGQMALFFSRAPIPARRRWLIEEVKTAVNTPHSGQPALHDPARTDAQDHAISADTALPECFLHIGLYAYRRAFLRTYQTLPDCAIEQEEQLEQLRALFHGARIHVGEVGQSSSRGVDHPEDISRVEAAMQSAS